jgi:hypothetical protein
MGKPLLLPIRHCQMIQLVFQSVDWLTEPYFFDIVFPLHFYLPKSLRHRDFWMPRSTIQTSHFKTGFCSAC